MKGFKLSFTVCCIALAYFLISSFLRPHKMLENVPPEVVIVKPAVNDRFLWNTIVQYKINVKDKEDGQSEYDEIDPKEVLLEVSYLPDAASAKVYADKKRKEKESIGLTMIRRSDCFSCHASKSKLIGPSFEMIAKRYPSTDTSVERLTKNIINGSTGTWATAAMPAHKALDVTNAKQMAKWILNNGANKNTTVYPGIEGAFKTTEKPATGSGSKVIVLTASYNDHGDKQSVENSSYGQHTVLMKAAN